MKIITLTKLLNRYYLVKEKLHFLIFNIIDKKIMNNTVSSKMTHMHSLKIFFILRFFKILKDIFC
jgi:hypothetical protein